MIYDINGNVLNDESLNRLVHKKISVIGDSFVSGTNENQLSDMWWYKIADRNDMTAQNLGVGGESLRVMVQNTRYINIENNADYIVVFTGHNDVSYDHTDLGTIEDIGNTTFYGCLKTLCAWLLNNRPYARILFVTPTHRSSDAVLPYVNAMLEVCRKYTIPCWDSYGKLGILIGEHSDVNQRGVYETTNVISHLNSLGQTYLSYKLEEQLKLL